jgi:hypothetical protein
MGQDVGVGAVRFFQGVGQGREAVEGSVVVTLLSKLHHAEMIEGHRCCAEALTIKHDFPRNWKKTSQERMGTKMGFPFGCSRHAGQSEDYIEFPIGEEPGIASDGRAVEFQLFSP